MSFKYISILALSDFSFVCALQIFMNECKSMYVHIKPQFHNTHVADLPAYIWNKVHLGRLGDVDLSKEINLI